MPITIPADGVWEFRGGQLVDPSSRSTYTTPYNYMVDPTGCDVLTHSKAGGTITINAFDPVSCEVTVMMVFSFKSLALTNPLSPEILPVNEADLLAVLAFINANYGAYIIASQALFFNPSGA